MSSNGKMKSQEDPNVRILRDLSHIPANKHCFDCGQRGPTYVNVTIGSFVCMTCSGLLRGLTPPHRVKSISMASFTSDEIELLKSKGNEYCRKVWLATCSAKDSNLGSEKDPSRLNLLKDFMSAKYEQKRFYVDPSKLTKTELNEIQAQTARALTSVSQNSSASLSSMQRSPSLSSTRSSSSQQSNPSPLLNNLRNGGSQHPNHQNRLVNSITLPDIKPLTSLIGPAVPSITSNQMSVSPTVNDATKVPTTGGPTPINFINNLTSSQQQNIAVTKTNNHNNILNVSPWSSESNGFRNGADSNFESSESNFADFEDAFSRNNLNGTNNDLFAGQNLGQRNNFNVSNSTGNGVSLQAPTLPGSIMPPPLLPFNTPGGNQTQPTIAINSTPTTSASNGLGFEDKYAALKDLDSLFKQSGNGDSVGANGTTNTQIGLTSSASLPANLSSSGSSGTGWFSTSANQNPFSQAPAPTTPQAVSGWNVGGTSINGTGNGGHNPFFGSGNAWKSPNNSLSNSGFVGGPSHSYCPVSSAATGQQQGFSPGIPVSSGKPFNPFFTPASNPNNPFL